MGHGAHINLDYSSKDVAVNTKEMLGCNFAQEIINYVHETMYSISIRYSP